MGTNLKKFSVAMKVEFDMEAETAGDASREIVVLLSKLDEARLGMYRIEHIKLEHVKEQK